MTVKIQGTIVSADYDFDMFESWISRGIITPSTRVVAALESAKEPVDVYINSYGGDVFAGGEMLIALQKCKTRKCLGRVEVGSIAASMAANIVAALRASGAEVVGHANSQLMFHGCYTQTEGGAQHHEDVAESLRNINESVISSLNEIGINDCRAWFAEGREKWMSSDEAKTVGLFSSVAEDEAKEPTEAKQTAARLAAFASSMKSRKDYQTMIDEAIGNDQNDATPSETPDIEAVRAEMEAKANERVAGIQSTLNKQISEISKERDAALEDLKAANTTVTSLKENVEKLEHDLAEVRDQLAKSESMRSENVVKALAPAPKKKQLSAWGQAYREAVRR